MARQGRKENTNSVNSWMKRRYERLRLELKDKDAWLAKLLDPGETPGFARWVETEGGSRELERADALSLRLIDNLIILREVFGLKPQALKKLLLNDAQGLKALEDEIARRKALVPWQAAMALWGAMLLEALGEADASLAMVDIEEVLSMAPHHADAPRYASLTQLAALRALEVALASDRPSAVWEAIDGHLQLGEAEAAEAMLDAQAPDTPGAPLEAVALRAALAGLRARQAAAASQSARFWRDEAAPLSGAEMAYDHLAMEEEGRWQSSVAEMMDRSFTLLAAAEAVGLRQAERRLVGLHGAQGVLGQARQRLLAHFGRICAREPLHIETRWSDLPKDPERRRLLAALAEDTVSDHVMNRSAAIIDAACVLRRLAPEILAAHRGVVEQCLRYRHFHRHSPSPFEDPAILALVDDLETWWAGIEPDWRAAADAEMPALHRGLALELIARMQEAQGPAAAIAELRRLDALGWIAARRPDGGPSLELTILAANWVDKMSEHQPPVDVRAAAEDERNLSEITSNQVFSDGSEGNLDPMQSRLDAWTPAGWDCGLPPLPDAAPES